MAETAETATEPKTIPPAIFKNGREVIIAQDCTWWGEGIDPKHFVSLLYISVAIKASLLKFSMFSVHKNTISNIFLEFSNFKIVGLVQIGIWNLLQ